MSCDCEKKREKQKKKFRVLASAIVTIAGWFMGAVTIIVGGTIYLYSPHSPWAIFPILCGIYAIGEYSIYLVQQTKKNQ